MWVGSSVYMGWWQCIQWSTGRLIYSDNQNKQEFNLKIFELFQIVNDQTKEHLLYQWIFKNYKIYCLEPMNVNWWANWLECISFLSHDNEVTVGGVKVQLEQGRCFLRLEGVWGVHIGASFSDFISLCFLMSVTLICGLNPFRGLLRLKFIFITMYFTKGFSPSGNFPIVQFSKRQRSARHPSLV